MNPTSWKDAYSKLAAATKPPEKEFVKKLYCADGGPFTYQDNILSFQQCMCDTHQDALVPTATNNSNMKEFREMLARTVPDVADSQQAQRGVASIPPVDAQQHKK
jgi:hypothetical protein